MNTFIELTSTQRAEVFTRSWDHIVKKVENDAAPLGSTNGDIKKHVTLRHSEKDFCNEIK